MRRSCLAGPALLLVGSTLPCAASAAGRATAVALNPTGLTAWSMFVNADWVVKTVILLLLGASMTTGAILLQKLTEAARARRAIVADLQILESSPSLAAIAGITDPVTAEMVAVATDETRRGGEPRNAGSAEALRERIALRFGTIVERAMQIRHQGLSVIGSIGATAPFIGLFGTVWGIMNSFIGIARSQTTSLAVVAPGIAEALLATGCGLVAAIPAVLIYNMLTRGSVAYRRMLREASVQIICLVSRDQEQPHDADMPTNVRLLG